MRAKVWALEHMGYLHNEDIIRISFFIKFLKFSNLCVYWKYISSCNILWILIPIPQHCLNLFPDSLISLFIEKIKEQKWSGIGWGKCTEALRPSRKNENREPQKIGGWWTLQNSPETCNVRDSQVSRRGTLNEMPDSRERDLIEPTSSRKTGNQVTDGVAISQSQIWPIIIPVWKNYRDGNGEETEEKKVQKQAQSGIKIKWRCNDLTLLLRLWSTQKRDLSRLTSERSNKLLKDSEADIFTQPIDRSSWLLLLN